MNKAPADRPMETKEKSALAAVIKKIRGLSRFEKYSDWWQTGKEEIPAPVPRDSQEQS
jgi:P2-related tail formation protein